jgi:hypothetical protein
MHLKITRDYLKDGDVFYFAKDPQYVHELHIDADGNRFDYVIGAEGPIPFSNVLAVFREVIVIHNTHASADPDAS